MTATTTADRRRIIELKLWMEDHDITVKATSEYLGWAFATTRYNLMVASEPKRREKLLALGFPSELPRGEAGVQRRFRRAKDSSCI
ncbi:MAG: hypothetical protein ACLSTO_06870 [Bilophila wadsworthia]